MPKGIKYPDDTFYKILELVKLEVDGEQRLIERLSFLVIGSLTAFATISGIFSLNLITPLLQFIFVYLIFAVIAMIIKFGLTREGIWRYYEEHYKWYKKIHKN